MTMRKLNRPSGQASFLAAAILAAVLSGCNSESNDSESSSLSSADEGSVQVVLTDADDAFLTYQVNITGLTLVREDGTEVDVLPATTEVDFVQYQELSELFTVASVPAGRYDSVRVGLDYSGADIVIQDGEGTAYDASVVDGDGNAVTSLDVELTLGDDQELNVRRGGLHGLTLDLDLAASNEILSYTPAVVEVEPFLMVVAAQDEEREHRARGLLQSVDTDASTVTVDVRPMRKREGEFGTQTITLTDETEYTIDGEELTGSDGLTQLATLEADTALIAYGVLDSDEGTFTAQQLIAGSSVPWSGDDVAKGIVTARSGNVLTIQAAVLERDTKEADFTESLTVTLADTTSVTAWHLDDTDIADISVGQRISVAGTYDSETGDVDVSDGSVRLKLSQVSGQVVNTSPLELDLAAVGNRTVDLFDFAGTGESNDDDADPDAYTIQTASLSLSNLELDDWVSVRGYPTEYGVANGDFSAISVNEISWTTTAASFVAHWLLDDTDGVTIDSDALTVDTSRATVRLRLRGVSREVSNLATVSRIEAAEQGRYAIHMAGEQDAEGSAIYSDFSEFLTALAEAQTGDEPVGHLTARGDLDPETETLTASMLVVRFGDVQAPDDEVIDDRESGNQSSRHSRESGQGGSHSPGGHR